MKRSIKLRITSYILLSYVIISIISILILKGYLQNESKKEYFNLINLIGKNVTDLVISDLFYSNYTEIENKIKMINFKDFEYIIVYDCISDLIAYKNMKNEIKFKNHLKDLKRIKDLKNDRYNIYTLENHSIYEFIFTIKVDNTVLGHLLIGVFEDKITSRFTFINKILLIYGILTFIFFSILIYILTNKIIHPIKELTKIIIKFAEGDYKIRSKIKTNDEIEVLSNTFNLMADKINEQIISIENYTKNLEQMVEERTEELYQAMNKLRNKEKKITEMEKMKSLNTLVSAIAHHINNPLTIISGNIELMMPKIKNEENLRRMTKVFKAVYEISNLIKDINFFSGIKDFSLTKFSLTSLINDVKSTLYKELEANKDIKLEIDDTTGIRIYGNLNLLSLALENIIRNSIQIFKKRKIKNPEIKISFKSTKEYFYFEIYDNGGGIEFAERAMEPFYTSFEENRGLGLTFVYFIAEVHSGEVNIKRFKDGTLVMLKIRNQ